MSAPSASAVDRTREQWIKNLIDLSRRNNLLYYRAVKGSFDLTNAPATLIHDFLAGKRVSLADLLPAQDPLKLGAQARALQRRAQINQEEKGLQTLFLAYGMAGWPSDDGGRPYEAAVLLFPVSITARWHDAQTITLQRDGDPQFNLALLHLLATQYGCPVDADELLALGLSNGSNGVNELNGEGDVFDPQPILARLRALAEEKRISAFSIVPRLVLNNFSFQKMAMVSDLQQHAEQFAAHDVLTAIAGDENARAHILSRRTEIDPRQLDAIPPDNEFLVLDADSSQQRVIQHVLNHESGVIQGPPGTGKSQTIVNLIAALVANGYRVLFVAEKPRRAGSGAEPPATCGAGPPGAGPARRRNLQRQRGTRHRPAAWRTIGHSTPAMTAGIHPSFVDRRTRLNRHDTLMHTPRLPSGLSTYEIQGQLLRSPLEVRAQTRWRSPQLDTLTREVAAHADGRNCANWQASSRPCRAIHRRYGPGRNCPALRRRNRRWTWHATSQTIACPHCAAALNTLGNETALGIPSTFAEIDQFLNFLASLQTLLAAYSTRLFDEDLTALASALAPATSLFSRLIAGVTDSAYRKALAPLARLAPGPRDQPRHNYTPT